MIYFITARDIGRVKIGHSQKPFARFSQIQCNSPVPLKLERVCAGGESEEARLHVRFSEHRISGEWFALTAEIEAHMNALSAPTRQRSVTVQGVTVDGFNATQLAAAIGVSKGRITQLKDKPWPPELALEAERVTEGALNAALLSPIIAQARHPQNNGEAA